MVTGRREEREIVKRCLRIVGVSKCMRSRKVRGLRLINMETGDIRVNKIRKNNDARLL